MLSTASSCLLFDCKRDCLAIEQNSAWIGHIVSSFLDVPRQRVHGLLLYTLFRKIRKAEFQEVMLRERIALFTYKTNRVRGGMNLVNYGRQRAMAILRIPRPLLVTAGAKMTSLAGEGKKVL